MCNTGEGNTGERNTEERIFQYSCLENSMVRGAWHAIVHGVARSLTQLSNYHTQCVIQNTRTECEIENSLLEIKYYYY